MRHTFVIYLFFIGSILFCCSCKQPKTDRQARYENTVQNNIGKPFYLADVADTSGAKVELDFSKTRYTIIDFWNTGCPPCIAEMKQFEALLKGKEKTFTVYSISVNQFWFWQKTLKADSGMFTFLNNGVTNWKQYDLLTKEDPKLKNDFATDRISELAEKYQVQTFPTYFVIDKTGKIVAMPESAVEFIKEND